MAIGTSSGAYYDDAHHRAAADWDDKYDENIVVPHPTGDINDMSPDKMMGDKQIATDPGNIYDDSGNIVDYKPNGEWGQSDLPTLKPMSNEKKIYLNNELSPLDKQGSLSSNIVPVSHFGTIPMDPKLFDDREGLENKVDEFIKNKKMNKDDRFDIEYPEGKESYKYLGPDSGGRKDWLRIKPNEETPMSSNNLPIVPVSDIKTYGMNPMIDVPEGTLPVVGGGSKMDGIRKRLLDGTETHEDVQAWLADKPKPKGQRELTPALMINGEKFTGENHGMAFEQFMNKYPDQMPKDYKDGFLDKSGKFLSREEAMKVAKEKDLLNPSVKEAIAKLNAANDDSTMLLSEDLE